MATIKCKQCNLVNFNTQINCKRCGNPLGETAQNAVGDFPATEIQHRQFQATASPYQTRTQPATSAFSAGHAFPADYAHFQAPPSPEYYSGHQKYNVPSCMKCGTTANTTCKSVTKEKVPAVAYLAMLLGLLPGLIIVLLLKKTHRLNISFCEDCYGKFKYVSLVHTLTGLFVLVGLIVTMFVAFASESRIALLLCSSFIGIVAFFGFRFCRRNDLKFTKLTRTQVVIRDPVHGDVTLV